LPISVTINSGHSGENCYFRDQVKNNKIDKNASLLHANYANQDHCNAFKKTYNLSAKRLKVNIPVNKKPLIFKKK